MNNYNIYQYKIFEEQEFNEFVQEVEEECNKELLNESETFHAIVDKFQRITVFTEPSFFGGWSDLFLPRTDLKEKKVTQMIKNLDSLYLESQNLIKSLKENPKQPLEPIKIKLIEIRLEILSKKSLQLREMITTLSDPSEGNEENPLLKDLCSSYISCLQEIAKISGNKLFSHHLIKEIALQNMPSWKNSLDQLDTMYLERIDLGKRIMQTESELTALEKLLNNPMIKLFSLAKDNQIQKVVLAFKYQQKQILLLKYDWAHVNLTIQSIERDLLSRIEPEEQEQRDIFRALSKDSQTQTETFTEAMRKTSKEIKKFHGKNALKEAHKTKWTYSLWGEALIKKNKEVVFSEQDAGWIQSFLDYTKNAVGLEGRFENKVNELKEKIRSLKVELNEIPDNEHELKEAIRSTQLQLYKFLFTSTLSALETADEELTNILQPALEKFIHKIQSLFESYSPEAAHWAKEHASVMDVLMQNRQLGKTYLPTLLKEYEKLCMYGAYQKNQLEESEEFIKAAIEINHSKLLILQMQRTVITEASRGKSDQFAANLNSVEKIKIESDSLAKESEGLIRQIKHLYPQEMFIGEEGSVPVVQTFFDPWTLTDWGSILVQRKKSSLTEKILQGIGSVTELVQTYKKTINDFQNRIDNLLGEIDQAKGDARESLELKNQLRMQILYLSQTHLNRMVDAVGERQRNIKNLNNQIEQKMDRLNAFPENNENILVREPIETEIADLKDQLHIAKTEVEILNKAYELLIHTYEKKYTKQQRIIESRKEKSFVEAGWTFATSIMKDLLPFTDMTLPSPVELKKKMQYARAGYSMIDEVQKFLSVAYNNAKKEGVSPQGFISEFLAKEVKGFISWAQDHPRTATLLAGDIMQVCSVMNQEGLVKQVQSSLHATLYTKAALGILHGGGLDIEESIETEEAFKYRALADLLKPMPALAGGLTGAVHGLYQGGVSLGAVTNALWGALKGATVAQTAQSMRKVIPAHLEQVAAITLSALQGESIQKIIEMNRNIELVGLGGNLIRTIQKPGEMLKEIKNWWEKIKRSSGREKFARVMTQVVVPGVSISTSAIIAYETSKVPYGIAVATVGSAPAAWIIAAGIILTIATFTLSFMLFSNRLIDLAAFSSKTLQSLAQEEEEKTKEMIKNELRLNIDLRSKFESIMQGYLEDFRTIGLIPVVTPQEIPSHFSQNLTNFIKTSEDPYYTDCIMVLQNYWEGSINKPTTPNEFALEFNRLLPPQLVKENAEKCIEQHIKSLKQKLKVADEQHRQPIEALITEIETNKKQLLGLLINNENQRLVDRWFKKHLYEMVEEQFYGLYSNYKNSEDTFNYMVTNKSESLAKACKKEIEENLGRADLNLEPTEIRSIASRVTKSRAGGG